MLMGVGGGWGGTEGSTALYPIRVCNHRATLPPPHPHIPPVSLRCLLQFAVVDVECSETIMKLQARDQRILELNKQVLRLNEEMREQSEWNALQLAQLRMTHQQEKEKTSRKSKAEAVDEDPSKKSKGRVMKPVSRTGGRVIDNGDNAARAEWDEV